MNAVVMFVVGVVLGFTAGWAFTAFSYISKNNK